MPECWVSIPRGLRHALSRSAPPHSTSLARPSLRQAQPLRPRDVARAPQLPPLASVYPAAVPSAASVRPPPSHLTTTASFSLFLFAPCARPRTSSPRPTRGNGRKAHRREVRGGGIVEKVVTAR
ncbi:hypothetical protein PUN28_015576 [Cardiocondyla obscurior]|uniref:Uncharacterized protein n=1 Tax=Cardiocondyla obscurior TaxID=286306 RepID=A0AAW2EV07_9HYME